MRQMCINTFSVDEIASAWVLELSIVSRKDFSSLGRHHRVSFHCTNPC